MTDSAGLSFGLLFNSQDPPTGASIEERWAEILDLAPVAERAGFESLHVPEHHMREDGYLPQPLIACAALAARTRRVRVGPTLTVAPLRHPVHLAEEAACVDVLSRGRLVLGLGIGDYEPEYDLFDVPIEEEASRFDETIQILLAAWTGSEVQHEGVHFRLDGVPIRPQPVQDPHPPIWIGAMSEPGCRRAGRFGLPLLLDPLHTITALEPLVETYREECERRGHEPEVVLMRWGWIHGASDGPARSWWPHVRPTMWTYVRDIPRFRTDIDADVASLQDEGDLELSALAQERFLVGDGNQIPGLLRDWTERLGCDRVILKLQGATGPWGDELRDAIVRFGDEVISAGSDRP